VASEVLIWPRAVYHGGVPCVLNDAFYPIILMGLDEPYLPGEIEAYLEKLVSIADEGLRTGKRHVVIVTNDPTKVSAAGRRRVANCVALHMRQEQIDVTLVSFMPIDSALVRGAMTAFKWFSPDTLKSLRVVSSVESALREALVALQEQGTPFTGDLQALRQALRLEG
jgi:hypothetical protein